MNAEQLVPYIGTAILLGGAVACSLSICKEMLESGEGILIGKSLLYRHPVAGDLRLLPTSAFAKPGIKCTEHLQCLSTVKSFRKGTMHYALQKCLYCDYTEYVMLEATK